MSYILEGLKKLEQKRQLEKGAPDLLAFQAESPHKTNKWPIWLYLLFAILFLNAGAMIWWIGPWRSSGRSTPAQQPATQQGTSMAVTESSDKQTPSKTTQTNEIQQPKVASASPVVTAGKETNNSLRPVAKETPVAVQSVTKVSVSPEPKGGIKSKPPVDGHVVKLNELPSDIRNTLPALKMSAHFFSADKQARFARINDKILHEGEILNDGLKVEEINPGGAVFSYKGYRFLMGINDK